jgi:hypothetical protein
VSSKSRENRLETQKNTFARGRGMRKSAKSDSTFLSLEGKVMIVE